MDEVRRKHLKFHSKVLRRMYVQKWLNIDHRITLTVLAKIKGIRARENSRKRMQRNFYVFDPLLLFICGIMATSQVQGHTSAIESLLFSLSKIWKSHLLGGSSRITSFDCFVSLSFITLTAWHASQRSPPPSDCRMKQVYQHRGRFTPGWGISSCASKPVDTDLALECNGRWHK